MPNLQDKLSTNDLTRLKQKLESIIADQKSESNFTGTATINLEVSCTAQVEVDFNVDVENGGAIALEYRYADKEIRSNPSELKELAVVGTDSTDAELTQESITDVVNDQLSETVYDLDIGPYGDVTLEDHEIQDYDIDSIDFDGDSAERFDAAEG